MRHDLARARLAAERRRGSALRRRGRGEERERQRAERRRRGSCGGIVADIDHPPPPEWSEESPTTGRGMDAGEGRVSHVLTWRAPRARARAPAARLSAAPRLKTRLRRLGRIPRSLTRLRPPRAIHRPFPRAPPRGAARCPRRRPPRARRGAGSRERDASPSPRSLLPRCRPRGRRRRRRAARARLARPPPRAAARGFGSDAADDGGASSEDGDASAPPRRRRRGDRPRVLRADEGRGAPGGPSRRPIASSPAAAT